MAELQNWYERQQPYVETLPDGDYWVVPVKYNHDDTFLDFFKNTSGQLKIQESLFKEEDDSAKVLRMEVKEQALEILVTFLNKFPPTSEEMLENSSIPLDSTGFHVELPDGSLYIKVLFWKRMIDNLVESPVPTSTAENPLLEEGIFAHFSRGTDLISGIDKLVSLLNLFKGQIQESDLIVEGLDIDFEIEQLNKVKPTLNEFIQLNFPGNFPEYRLNSQNNRVISLEIGFTRQDYKLLYISMAQGETWQENLLNNQLGPASKLLNIGIENLKRTPPFDHQRTNTFLYLLNDIVSKYGALLQSPAPARSGDDIPPWHDFVNRFVYKDDSNEIIIRTSNTPQIEQQAQSVADPEQTTTLPQATDTITPAGPTPISPELKEELANEANAANELVVDTKLKEVLDNSQNIDSLEDVYGILNTVSISVLTKLALSSVQTCLSPADVEQMYCKEDFISLTMGEVEGVIIPCLNNATAASTAPPGGVLIASPAAPPPVFVDRGYMADDLQSIIDNKRKALLELAQQLDPANFDYEPDGDDPLYSTNTPSATDIEKIEALYCTNSAFREKIGAPPTDLKQELDEYFLSLTLEEKVTLCACISDNYGSKVDSTSDFDLLLYTIGGAAIAALIANGSISPTMGGFIADQLGIPVNALLGHDTPPTTDFIRDYQELYETSMLDIIESILVGSIVVILELVKHKLFGGTPEQELCGAPSDLYPFGTVSPLNLIMQSPPRTRGNVPYGEFDAADIIANCFSKNKIRYSETNQTVDFLNDVASMVTASGLRGLFKPSLSSAQTTKNFQRILDLAANKYSDSIGKDLRTISKAKTLFKCIGEFIDDAVLQAFIDEAAALKNSALLICKEELCEDALYEQLLKYLTEEDALEQCRQNKLDNLEKIKNILPFLDNSKLQEMIPSLFCVPCTDKEVVLPSIHESQTYLNETMNLEVFTLIDESFNQDIDKYKPLLLDAKGDITSLIYGPSTDGSNNTKLTEIMRAIYDNDDTLKDTLNAEVQSGKKVAPRIYNELAKELDKDNIKTWSVSSKLQATGQTTLLPELQVISYATSSYSYHFVLLLNSGEGTAEWDGLENGIIIEVSSQSMKLVIYDQNASKLELEHEFSLGLDVSQEKFKNFMMEYLAPYGGWGGESTIELEAISNVIGSFYGQVLTDIFERSLVETTNTGLFNREKFSKLALKNPPCGSNAIDQGILNINEKVSEINEWAKALECFIPRGDGRTPSALEVANVMGLYSIFLKVFVTQEYLKNIFVFSLYRISDITRSEVYMNFIYDNVLQKIQALEKSRSASLSFQEHALVLVKARADYGDNIPTEALYNKESAIRFLIMEAAVDVSNVLDNRIQEQILTPLERAKYQDFLQVGAQTADLSEDFISSFISYSTYPEILSPGNLAPLSQDNKLYFGATQYENIVPPKGGGLFFQEYFEISSKFATKDGSVDLTKLIDQKIRSFPGAGTPTGWVHREWGWYPDNNNFNHDYINDGNIISPYYLAESGAPDGENGYYSKDIRKAVVYFKNIIVSDPKFSFLVRPGVVLPDAPTEGESLSGEDYCVWSNLFGTKVEITNPLPINIASAQSFKYRGKTDLNVSIPYYQDSALGLDRYLWPSENAHNGYVMGDTDRENETVADALILNSLTLNAPYTDWFKPIKYGIRLMVSIQRTEANGPFFDSIVNVLNGNEVNNEAENYIKLLEDKIIHYKDGMNPSEPGHLIFSLVDVSEVMINSTLSVRTLFASVIPSLLETAQLNQKLRRSRLLGEMVTKIQTEYQDLFKKIIPIKELVLMVTLYQRIAMEEMYPEIDDLFDSTLSGALDAINMQFAAFDKDYQYNTQDFTGIDTDLDWGPLVISALKMTLGLYANVTDPTWRTQWFLPGPATAVGVAAKILNDVEIDYGGTTGGTQPQLSDNGLEGVELVKQGEECEGEVLDENADGAVEASPPKPPFLIKPS